jgi:hypothetical protein
MNPFALVVTPDAVAAEISRQQNDCSRPGEPAVTTSAGMSAKPCPFSVTPASAVIGPGRRRRVRVDRWRQNPWTNVLRNAARWRSAVAVDVRSWFRVGRIARQPSGSSHLAGLSSEPFDEKTQRRMNTAKRAILLLLLTYLSGKLSPVTTVNCIAGLILIKLKSPTVPMTDSTNKPHRGSALGPDSYTVSTLRSKPFSAISLCIKNKKKTKKEKKHSQRLHAKER